MAVPVKLHVIRVLLCEICSDFFSAPKLTKMDVDCRGNRRGACRNCPDCSFISEIGAVRCAYCGCPPGQHELGKDVELK